MRQATDCARIAFRACQRGQAILFVVLLLGIGIGLFAYGAVQSVSLVQQQDVKTRLALTMARDALIGRAASDLNRPGSLPCPDVNDDGVLTLSVDYFSGGVCASLIGRLPWRTLGLPDLRDESGERLWYALSNSFSDNTSVGPINSDTKGNITVYLDSTATPMTPEAVAVIFAPGAPLGTQSRSTSATALCPTTGTIIAQNLCAANYLDSTGGINNATPNANPLPVPSFIVAQRSASFNDRVLVLTTSELMPVVEARVARELRTILQNYKANTACACTNLGGTAGCYPWADLSNSYSDAPPYQLPGVGLNRGRIPVLGAAPHHWGDWLDPVVYPSCPPSTYVPTLPLWFDINNWRLVVYYSAGQNFLGPGGCSSCVNPTLTVDGVSGKEVVILMPGPLLAAALAVPPATTPRAPVALNDWTYWQYYFEDPPNNDYRYDNLGNDLYVTPSSTAYTRDRIFTIP